VLAARGVEASVEELMKLAGTDETGTTMAGLARAAEAKGMTATGYQVTFAGLRKIKLPVVAWVNRPIADLEGKGGGAAGNHYVVVTRGRGKYVWVMDPGGGAGDGQGERSTLNSQLSTLTAQQRGRRVAAEAFGRVWAGQVLEVTRGGRKD
jgi:predicted double-glycine peptidase